MSPLTLADDVLRLLYFTCCVVPRHRGRSHARQEGNDPERAGKHLIAGRLAGQRKGVAHLTHKVQVNSPYERVDGKVGNGRDRYLYNTEG